MKKKSGGLNYVNVIVSVDLRTILNYFLFF